MSNPNSLVDAQEEYFAKQDDLLAIVDLLGDDLDFSNKKVLERLGAVDADDALTKFQKRNDEVEVLGQRVKRLNAEVARDQVRDREQERQKPGAIVKHPLEPVAGRRKTFGQLFAESKEFKISRQTRVDTPLELDIGIKALFLTTSGFDPEDIRSGLLVPDVTRPILVLDLFPVFQIGQSTFVYMEETTRTHAAAETAEGAAFPESTFVWTQQTSEVRKIADSIPVTDEQLEDEQQVRSLLDQRLRFGLRQRLDGQVLTGNGTAPNLRGINNVVGIQTRARSTDARITAFARALTDIRVTGRAMPDGSIMHPNDWTEILLTQNSNGDYIFGNPFQGPGPQALFGIPVAQSDAQTENTVIVGDFANFSRLDDRRGVTVQTGYVGTQFTEGEVTIRADLRVAFTITRPAAFIQVTGM